MKSANHPSRKHKYFPLKETKLISVTRHQKARGSVWMGFSFNSQVLINLVTSKPAVLPFLLGCLDLGWPNRSNLSGDKLTLGGDIKLTNSWFTTLTWLRNLHFKHFHFVTDTRGMWETWRRYHPGSHKPQPFLSKYFQVNPRHIEPRYSWMSFVVLSLIMVLLTTASLLTYHPHTSPELWTCLNL